MNFEGFCCVAIFIYTYHTNKHHVPCLHWRATRNGINSTKCTTKLHLEIRVRRFLCKYFPWWSCSFYEWYYEQYIPQKLSTDLCEAQFKNKNDHQIHENQIRLENRVKLLLARLLLKIQPFFFLFGRISFERFHPSIIIIRFLMDLREEQFEDREKVNLRLYP